METIITPTTNFPPLLTVQEAASVLRVHETTIYAWIKKGNLEAINLPSGIHRIKEEALWKLLGK